MAVELDFNNVFFTLNLVLDGFFLSTQIGSINVSSIDILHCKFGKQHSSIKKHEINLAFKLSLPFVNPRLREHLIEIPSKISLFELSNLTLGYYDGFIFAGATPTFVNPGDSVDSSETGAVQRMTILSE